MIPVQVLSLGTVKDAFSGKEAEGLTVSFGQYKEAKLSWKTFKSLLKMSFEQTQTVEPPSIPSTSINRVPTTNSVK